MLFSYTRLFVLIVICCSLSNCRWIKRTGRRVNFKFTSREVVQQADQDFFSYSSLVFNNRFTNRTSIGRLSETKTVHLRLEPNNYLVKIIKFVRDEKGVFRPIHERYQPRERFMYVRKRKRTVVEVKYTLQSRRYELKVDFTNR